MHMCVYIYMYEYTYIYIYIHILFAACITRLVSTIRSTELNTQRIGCKIKLSPTWQQGETTRSCVLLTHARAPTPNTWPCMRMCIDCSNVTQTVPHGSCYRQTRSQGSVRRMRCWETEIRSTQMPTKVLVRLNYNKNGADASQNCSDADVDKSIGIEIPASCIPFSVC